VFGCGLSAVPRPTKPALSGNQCRVDMPPAPGTWHLAPGTWHLAPGNDDTPYFAVRSSRQRHLTLRPFADSLYGWA